MRSRATMTSVLIDFDRLPAPARRAAGLSHAYIFRGATIAGVCSPVTMATPNVPGERLLRFGLPHFMVRSHMIELALMSSMRRLRCAIAAAYSHIHMPLSLLTLLLLR